MFEVIIERPRWNGWRLPKGRRKEHRRKLEASPREPMSIGRGSKALNENLAPLRRFLLRRVGRPWDAVRGEICARIRPASAVQMHVLEHVKQMVEEHAVLIDGVPHHPEAWGRKYRPLGWNRWRGFYVCPETGVLRVVERPKLDRKRAARRRIGCAPTTMLFTVQNLGRLEEATIDLGKDLIVLTGPNNTSKTYVAHAIYGFCSKVVTYTHELVSEAISPPLGQESPKEITVDTTELLDICASTGLNQMAQKYARQLPDVFATSNESFPRAQTLLGTTTPELSTIRASLLKEEIHAAPTPTSIGFEKSLGSGRWTFTSMLDTQDALAVLPACWTRRTRWQSYLLFLTASRC
jgi:hypothetical protein